MKIKFRGKAINGEWLYGLLSISQGFQSQPERGYYISNRAGQPWAYQVIPETVGQFIGLSDKNGKEIYEGDIVKNWYDTELNWEVYYDDAKFWLRSGNRTYGDMNCCDDRETRVNFEKSEIIGNIYEKEV